MGPSLQACWRLQLAETGRCPAETGRSPVPTDTVLRMLRRVFVTIAAAALLAALPAIGAETALDRYVKKPDPTYSYKVVNTVKGDGYTTFIVEMTSQTWRKETEVDRTVWKHWLTIVKPDQVSSSTGYLFITGGSTRDKQPAGAGAQYVEIATTTHTVAAELQDFPNEPVTFAD